MDQQERFLAFWLMVFLSCPVLEENWDGPGYSYVSRHGHYLVISDMLFRSWKDYSQFSLGLPRSLVTFDFYLYFTDLT